MKKVEEARAKLAQAEGVLAKLQLVVSRSARSVPCLQRRCAGVLAGLAPAAPVLR
jgi:hypothetical protein